MFFHPTVIFILLVPISNLFHHFFISASIGDRLAVDYYRVLGSDGSVSTVDTKHSSKKLTREYLNLSLYAAYEVLKNEHLVG